MKDIDRDKSNHVCIKVLVIERDSISHKVTKHLLENLGCEVDFVNPGQSAFYVDWQKYQAIFLTVLPDMGEIELLEEIKKTTAKIPVVAYTACGKEIVEKCLESGFDDVIEKPATKEDFEGVIRKWVLK